MFVSLLRISQPITGLAATPTYFLKMVGLHGLDIIHCLVTTLARDLEEQCIDVSNDEYSSITHNGDMACCNQSINQSINQSVSYGYGYGTTNRCHA